MTTKKRWTEIREKVFIDQCGKCFCCGKIFFSHEEMHAHHAVYTKQKGMEKWLDSEQNILLICPACHADHGKLSNLFMRCCVWSDKIDHGYDMENWHLNIPMLLKDNFVYIGKSERNA
jgi:5-methylcytosine-specific restriction endonuclease McrA